MGDTDHLLSKFCELVSKLGHELPQPVAAGLFQKIVAAGDKPNDPMMAMLAAATGFSPASGLDEAINRAGTAPFSSLPAGSPVPFIVGGSVEPGYEPVQAAFASNFAKGLERNSQLCIYHKGKCVVDLWGSSDEPGVSTAPSSGYDGDTLQIVFSSTKACASVVMAVAADRGLFKYSDKVSSLWPEFAQAGKADMTIADVLRHDAGLHSFCEQMTVEDQADQANPNGRLAQIIAASPSWKFAGGSAECHTPRIYHATSRGYILNQILIRADPKGRTIGQWMHEEVCGKIGADFFCGNHDPSYLPRDRAGMKFPDFAHVFANTIVAGAVKAALKIAPDEWAAKTAAFHASDKYKYWHPNVDLKGQGGQPRFNGSPGQDAGEIRKYHNQGFGPDPATEGPSSTGRATARGMAKVMALMANGGELDNVRIMSAAGVEEAVKNPVVAADRVDGAEGEMQPFMMCDTAFVQGGW